MKASRQVVAGCLHAPQDSGVELPDASLLHDCALYFRDLAMAAVIFLPIWALLYLLRVLVFSH